jgi:hypothetical protein
MELQLTDSVEFMLNDSMDIEIPSYMQRLNPEDISRDTCRSKLIIAAGVDVKDQHLMSITGDGRILLFSLNEYFIPNGPAIPFDGGKQIFFENVNGRWPGDAQGFFADSEWIIEKSTSALKDASLQINYPHENNDK